MCIRDSFKISRHIKVFVEVISAFLFFGILDTTIQVRREVELILFVELHEQLRITGIHAGFNAILYQLVVCLLYTSPDSPQQHIRMLHLVYLIGGRFSIDKLTDSPVSYTHL